MEATEEKLNAFVKVTRRKRDPLRGIHEISLRVVVILGKCKMNRHFRVYVTETSFSYACDEDAIALEAKLDGVYVVRTSVELSDEEVVCTYKQLSVAEKAFWSIKTVDLKVRPIYHDRSHRIQCHIFACMLANYVEWHMRPRLAPMLFGEEDQEAAKAARTSVVAPAEPSTATWKKARTRTTGDGTRALAFPALMDHLVLLIKDQLEEKTGSRKCHIAMFAQPTEKQAQAFKPLGVRI